MPGFLLSLIGEVLALVLVLLAWVVDRKLLSQHQVPFVIASEGQLLVELILEVVV